MHCAGPANLTTNVKSVAMELIVIVKFMNQTFTAESN